jgi:hypothetical protein
MSNPWETNHEKLATVFQEGILDRIGSKVRKPFRAMGNLASGLSKGVMHNPQVKQIEDYINRKYQEIENDIGQLIKDSPQKVEMGDSIIELKKSFEGFNTKVEEIYTREQRGEQDKLNQIDPTRQQPQQNSTPPPLPQQQQPQQNSTPPPLPQQQTSRQRQQRQRRRQLGLY